VIGAAPYEIDVPPQWNGTLFLYSHGYVAPTGAPNPARSAPLPAERNWLLEHHFAAAGSAYSSSGWAVEDALRDQMALLDLFTKQIGTPKRVIAWGASLGGLITAGLVQLHPDRFTAAIAECGVLAGGVATWNAELDAAYAYKTLLAPNSELQLVHITDSEANRVLAHKIYIEAQTTARGEARLALVAALIDLPGWFNPMEPEPAATDYVARARAQAAWESGVDFAFAFGFRLELEQRAGGNPSWNVGVDYSRLLAQSPSHEEVKALYAAAGLDLEADLQLLNSGKRIKADPGATAYLDRNLSLDGLLQVPVLSIHTTDDGLVIPGNERVYAETVAAAGNSAMLRQLFVHRAGHCAFTPAETIAAIRVLLKRLDSGSWDEGALKPSALNADATRQGASASEVFGVTLQPAFVDFTPPPYPRPHPKGAPIPA
jgi:pimeloyl-ACP methyl ester carboxylesterase